MNKRKNNNSFKIIVTHGSGEGRTNISAFDSALMQAGIANYNLICLSSVIPKASRIKIEKFKTRENEYGNKLYVVMARCDQKNFGEEAWAGLGWIQDKNGRGLFVEHKGESEKSVIRLIKNSIEDMRQYRKYQYGNLKYFVSGIKCKDKPVCALVMAVYQSEEWKK